jgi:divalent metal cation (Fe/Co/Zn/Cd) transporter
MQRVPKECLSDRAKKVVVVAIIANLALAICKYVAAVFTGSSAMFAEAFHSTADTGNEFLLLIGMKRSMRPPDALHPFGHGKVLYFYSSAGYPYPRRHNRCLPQPHPKQPHPNWRNHSGGTQ